MVKTGLQKFNKSLVDTVVQPGIMVPQAKEIDMTIVMQRAIPGLYTSDLIDGRFQVIQSSAIKSHFFIYDHTKDDNIRGRDGMILRFETADEAHAHLAGTPAKAGSVAKTPKEPKVKAEKTLRKARVVTAGEVDVRERKERKGSMLSVIRGMIRDSGSDEEVFARLKAEHPDATYGLKTVVILRKEMGLA